MLLGELLKSVTGDDGYPGDTAASEHWPGRRARHARHPQRALAQVLQLGGDRRPRPKPPILWTHGAQDIVVADGSPWEMGTLGSLGVVPGWPGEAFAPQPMVSQIRARARALRGARRARRDASASRSPATSRRSTRASAGARGSSASWSPSMSYAVPGLVMTDHELQVPLDHARPGRRADHDLRARGRRAGGAREAVPRLLPGRPGVRGVRGRPATRAGPGFSTAR